MQDEDVTKRAWIYEYLLTLKEKYLNIRAFKDTEKRKVYEKQKWICKKCEEHFELNEMEADHITPWHEW
jgi:transposase-like protein